MIWTVEYLWLFIYNIKTNETIDNGLFRPNTKDNIKKKFFENPEKSEILDTTTLYNDKLHINEIGKYNKEVEKIVFVFQPLESKYPLNFQRDQKKEDYEIEKKKINKVLQKFNFHNCCIRRRLM